PWGPLFRPLLSDHFGGLSACRECCRFLSSLLLVCAVARAQVEGEPRIRNPSEYRGCRSRSAHGGPLVQARPTIWTGDPPESGEDSEGSGISAWLVRTSSSAPGAGSRRSSAGSGTGTATPSRGMRTGSPLRGSTVTS